MSINMPKNIVDKTGFTYPLDASLSPSLWVLRLLGPGNKGVVGQANCIPDDKVLRLMDLHITDEFRRKGLGSNLLKVIIEAVRFHFRMIEGVMKAGDLKEYPALPAWYEQHGFEVDRAANPMTFRLMIHSDPQPGTIAPTKDAIAAAAEAWARRHPSVQRVWLYGSRITGISSNTKKPPAPDTDWDIAIEIDGTSEDDRRMRWFAFKDQALDELQALTNWKIDVHHCDPQFDPERVAVEVVKGSILVYKRDAAA
jgi:Polymerase beta, Nucleotidyltransferase